MDLCNKGDKLVEEGVAALYNKVKGTPKGKSITRDRVGRLLVHATRAGWPDDATFSKRVLTTNLVPPDTHHTNHHPSLLSTKTNLPHYRTANSTYFSPLPACPPLPPSALALALALAHDPSFPIAGIAFPTSLAVNNIISNFSPVPVKGDAAPLVLAKDDVVKITIGAHIDGYAVVSAET